MMKKFVNVLATLVIVGSTAFLGCVHDDGPIEESVDAIDDVADETGDAFDEVGDEADDAFDEVGDETDDAIDDVEDELD